MMKPFSQACENNREPILDVLVRIFSDTNVVQEIGSGTGQHAVFFAKHLPHVTWYTGDLCENHDGIQAWLNEAQLPNVKSPIEIDADLQPWNLSEIDAVFSANTLHIMSWPQVENFFQGLDAALGANGLFAYYGPFNYNGKFTSDSNARFNDWLKLQASHRSIRDFEAVNKLAESIGMKLVEDNAMPANNRLIVWEKSL